MATAIVTENPTKLSRLMAKTNKHGPGGCWLWTGNRGARNNPRYGRIWDGVKQGYAHQMSYELFRGPVTDGQMVLHTCDVMHCVNPGHLFLGDAGVNARDREAKGRSAYHVGVANPAAKLTPAIVRAMRKHHAVHRSLKTLADKHGVCKETVQKVVRRQTWKHVN